MYVIVETDESGNCLIVWLWCTMQHLFSSSSSFSCTKQDAVDVSKPEDFSILVSLGHNFCQHSDICCSLTEVISFSYQTVTIKTYTSRVIFFILLIIVIILIMIKKPCCNYFSIYCHDGFSQRNLTSRFLEFFSGVERVAYVDAQWSDEHKPTHTHTEKTRHW